MKGLDYFYAYISYLISIEIFCIMYGNHNQLKLYRKIPISISLLPTTIEWVIVVSGG